MGWMSFCAVLLLWAVAALANDLDLAQQGRQTYNSYCITCHGPNLVNFGTRAPDLRKFPLDQSQRFVDSVMNGKDAMPAWKDTLSEEDVLAVWAYVKTRGK